MIIILHAISKCNSNTRLPLRGELLQKKLMNVTSFFPCTCSTSGHMLHRRDHMRTCNSYFLTMSQSNEGEEKTSKFRCPECQYSCNWKQNLNRHWKSIHNKPLAILNNSHQKHPASLSECSEHDDEGSIHFTCPLKGCEFESAQVEAMLEHLKEYHNETSGMYLNPMNGLY